ncbi:MAG: hypothetical protein JNJ90_00285 [Saprospiraceae bacterium]|jgi:antitoxin component YwqK of YwqJK toxin-antitoxin module|nr:hypothetical protein [Saprospiraceae bacterium]
MFPFITQRAIALATVLTLGFCFACNENPKLLPTPAQPVEKTEKYGTGSVSRRYQEIGGKKQGLMTDYYPDGRLKAERWFEDDKQTGRTALYYPGGQIREVQYYENGLKEGGDTLFYEHGRVQFVANFHREKKNGYLRKWSPTGDLIFEARYEMDSLVEVKGKSIKTVQ